EPETSLRLTTRSEAPAGSGLGGSSSLAVSMLGALQAFLARTIMAPDRMVRVARDLEARVLGIPTGTQDHYAAVYGGAAAIRYGPGGPIREPLGLDLGRLGERLVLAFTGASRMSATANWDMMRRVIDGDREARAGLVSIAAIAQEMRGALLEGDLDAAAGLLDREWAQRRRLSPKVTTGNIDGALAAARAAGAIGGKVCGAGGGGCVALLCREGTREPVVRALEAMASDGVRVLTARPTAVGLQLVG
ncbi:MAG TPA: hypothetical protein VFP98_06170, partial [Candidatus Polarisedimenticolia bacterium]|nr:hypothetical protein [Candidatus Polarisedimenticolia bacterium]